MAEYIEKNKAIKELYEVYDYEFPTASGGFDEYARMIVPNTIKNMPAADVAPVRHGRWIDAYPDIEPNLMFMYGICSECGFEQAISKYLKYCPDCGAKMDGGIEND